MPDENRPPSSYVGFGSNSRLVLGTAAATKSPGGTRLQTLASGIPEARLSRPESKTTPAGPNPHSPSRVKIPARAAHRRRSLGSAFPKREMPEFEWEEASFILTRDIILSPSAIRKSLSSLHGSAKTLAAGVMREVDDYVWHHAHIKPNHAHLRGEEAESAKASNLLQATDKFNYQQMVPERIAQIFALTLGSVTVGLKICLNKGTRVPVSIQYQFTTPTGLILKYNVHSIDQRRPDRKQASASLVIWASKLIETALTTENEEQLAVGMKIANTALREFDNHWHKMDEHKGKLEFKPDVPKNHDKKALSAIALRLQDHASDEKTANRDLFARGEKMAIACRRRVLGRRRASHASTPPEETPATPFRDLTNTAGRPDSPAPTAPRL